MMLETRFSKPAKHLQPFVRFYVQRNGNIRGESILHPVPARAASMIEFDFADPVDTYFCDERVVRKSTSITVVGPQTYRRVEMQLRGTLDSFVVMFQPAGFHQLFSVPMPQLAGKDGEGHAILGARISHIRQRMGEASSFEKRIALVDDWLSRLSTRVTGEDGLSSVASRLVVCGGGAGIPALAEESGLSLRQFERKFLDKVGLRPKLFARIARFEAALVYKARFRAKSWTETAHHFGYHDQAHMNYDFSKFTGETPTEILVHFRRVFMNNLELSDPGTLEEEGGEATKLIL